MLVLKASRKHMQQDPSTYDASTREGCLKKLQRLRELGLSLLSNGELIVILLRAGVAGESALNPSTRLLADFGGLLSGMARASYGELGSLKGISEAKAAS